MSFQDFCDQEQDVDEQQVSINNTCVISFGKPDGTSFNVDPGDIAIFLEYLRDQHDICRSAVESHPRYTAESFIQYQEKPYRALYKLTVSDERLNTIRSLGGSQTKELTKIISKLICFLADVKYIGIEKDTQFDKNVVELALKKMPEDLRTLAGVVNTPSKARGVSNKESLENWSLSLTKPFLLLAGISGTGKTRFVREQARTFDADLNNFCLVPVRPDWHEPSDLLGYVTRLTGTAQYVPTEVVKFIVRAWLAVAPHVAKEGCGELDGTAVPYWLCLDEMNLAPVEQYFADYLSVLESRKFENGLYECDALIDKDMFQLLAKDDANFRANLGVESDAFWAFFLANGIQLPPNLIVAGTVNMDETTHGFSRKVIDRAVTLDFGEFFPNDYSAFFNQTTLPVTFSWPMVTHASEAGLAATVDNDGTKSIAFLESVNEVLKKTPFELAYRALNELLLQVSCFQPATDGELQAVWDDFLMTKVLPRIDGDEDKLRSIVTSGQRTVLYDLEKILIDKFKLIWPDELNRKDYFRVSKDTGKNIEIKCRSKFKLQWMRDRLEANTFTSFWP